MYKKGDGASASNADLKKVGVNMNLFEFFTKLHNDSTKSWIETTATFTGRRNKAMSRTKIGYRELDYYEYEITYYAGDKKKRGFYSFYPLPDPEIEEIEGESMKIKYNKKKPYIFVAAE